MKKEDLVTKEYLEGLVKNALKEDFYERDVTTLGAFPGDLKMRAVLVAKENGVIAGLPVVKVITRVIKPTIKTKFLVKEGTHIKKGDKILILEGSAYAILSRERTLINFLGHLSGIATKTHEFVQKLKGTKTKILDTRKTIPGLRNLQKYAVRVGGGKNHRLHLADMVLVKDNHIDFGGGITKVVNNIRGRWGSRFLIEVETRTLAEVKETLGLKVDGIMLDNMSLSQMRQAVRLARGKIPLEASGNITLKNARKIAQTGVDFISSGALTHSVKSFDFSLKKERMT